MRNKERSFKKDEIIMFDSGEYDCYSVDGVVIATKDFNICDALSGYFKTNPGELKKHACSFSKLLDYLNEKGFTKNIKYKSVYLGYFGTLEEDLKGGNGIAITCTRCDQGFLNTHQMPEHIRYYLNSPKTMLNWLSHNKDNDISVCDCCGDGEDWYGFPGEHYNNNDPMGKNGPYAYNGGLCECH